MCGVLLEGDFTEEGGVVEAGFGGVDGTPRDEVGLWGGMSSS